MLTVSWLSILRTATDSSVVLHVGHRNDQYTKSVVRSLVSLALTLLCQIKKHTPLGTWEGHLLPLIYLPTPSIFAHTRKAAINVQSLTKANES